MIKIENFDSLPSSGITYGGHGGSKKGIIINDEKWFLKFPKSTKSMRNIENMSYTTTPLSEYIGSHIYKSIGIDTHDTKLGISNGKVVVACKDFLNPTEIILDYNSIKNEYDEKIEQTIEDLSSSSLHEDNNNLEEILVIMDNNSYFEKVPELKLRFWDMFIIDTFINNTDRNEGNWGLVLDKKNSNLRVAPVFDNGAAFYNKSNDERLISIYNDSKKFKQSTYDSAISIYREKNKIINPLKFIESMKSEDCNKAILRIVPNIDMKKIEEIFNEIPTEYNRYTICSKIQKDFYFKSLEFKYKDVLLPIYNKLLEKDDL